MSNDPDQPPPVQPGPPPAPPGMYQASDGQFYPVEAAPMTAPSPPKKRTGKVLLVVAACIVALCVLAGVVVALVASSDKDEVDVGASTTTVAAVEPSAAYQAAVDQLREVRAANTKLRSAAVERYAKVTATPAEQQSALADAKKVAADDRTALFDFDAKVRKIASPEDVRPLVSALLTENGNLIALMDRYAQVTDADGYDQAVKAENAATKTWGAAVDKLAQALKVPGFSRATSTTATTGSPSGQVLRGAGYHLTVPPGFTGRGGGTISVQGPDKVRITTGLLSGYSGPLADVARKSTEAAASKQGATVEAGPLDQDTGAGKGVAHRLVHSNGDTELEVIVAKGTKYVSISLYGPKDAMQAQMPAFLQALSTFGFDE